jgi:hypothetical protein
MKIHASIHASMQDIVVDAELAAEMDRRLELPIWGVVLIFGIAFITTILLQGPLWLVGMLSAIFGAVLGELASCRRRRRRARARAARFKKLLNAEAPR